MNTKLFPVILLSLLLSSCQSFSSSSNDQNVPEQFSSDQLSILNLALHVESSLLVPPRESSGWAPTVIQEIVLIPLGETSVGTIGQWSEEDEVWSVKLTGRWMDPQFPDPDGILKYLEVVIDPKKGVLVGQFMSPYEPPGW
jgi:hypothetical protein